MHGLIIQNGYINNDSQFDFSNLTKNQIKDLRKIGINSVNITTYRLNNPFHFLLNLIKIKKKISENNFDFIHIQYGSILGFLGIFLNNSNKIISICGSDIIFNKNSPIKSFLLTRITKFSLFFYPKIIVKSNNLKSLVPKRLQNRISLIPNGVDSEFYFEKTQKLNDKFIVAFNIGLNNKPIKNFQLAKKTIEILNQKIPNLKFELISNLSPQLVRNLLQNSQCLLLTSFHEGSPNIVKEALMVNTPVVSVNCGDVKERLKNVNKGGVSINYDPEELSELILEVYHSKLKFNGREILLKQKLDSKSISLKLSELYLK